MLKTISSQIQELDMIEGVSLFINFLDTITLVSRFDLIFVGDMHNNLQ